MDKVGMVGQLYIGYQEEYGVCYLTSNKNEACIVTQSHIDANEESMRRMAAYDIGCKPEEIVFVDAE